MVKRTLIVVWKQNYIGRNPKIQFWGFGDVLRGLCGVLDVCDELGIEVAVDMRHHPLSYCFAHQSHGYEHDVDTHIDQIPLQAFSIRTTLKHYLEKAFENKLVHVMGAWVDPYIFANPLKNKTKEYIRRLLSPTTEFAMWMNSHQSDDVPANVLHFRLGDDHLVRKKGGNTYEVLSEKVRKHSTTPIYVVSDSPQFKSILQKTKIPNVSVSNVEPCHLGVESDPTKVMATVAEYLLLSHAKTIHTYSVYGWTSGFVHSVHRIFDVPLRKLS